MEQENVSLAPSNKRSKRLAVKKINNKKKRSFSYLSKSNPLTLATRATGDGQNPSIRMKYRFVYNKL